MRKIINIALKDVRITYRDITALLLILVAPLAMTMIMDFAFSESDSGFSQIPVAIIDQNNEEGVLGGLTRGIFESDEIAEYLSIEYYQDLSNALKQLDNDKVAAVIVMPESSFDNLLEFNNQEESRTIDDFRQNIDLYTSATRPISGMIVESILDSVVTELNTGYAAGALGFEDILTSEGISLQDLTEEKGQQIGEEISTKLEPLFTENLNSITVESQYQETEADETGFNWLGYMAPSMAILYLGFSMNTSSKSILSEREKGTLPRLLCSPSKPYEIIIGKMLGTFFIGLIQVLLFVVFSSLLLNLDWGDPLVILLFTFSVVLASASWGILIAALSKNSGQASAIGMAINLTFAAVAGNFYPRINFPDWLQNVGYLTPNAWGIEGFLELLNGGTISDIFPAITALLTMSIILLAVATFSFAKQYGKKR